MTDADRLRAAGLRVTSARLAIGDAVRAGGLPGTAGIARAGRSRHRLVCRGCGAVARVDRVTGHSACLEPAADAGFTIERAEVTFRGLCPRCRRSPAGPGTGPAPRAAGG